MKMTIVASDDNGSYVDLTREIDNVRDARNFADNVYNLIDCTPKDAKVSVYDTLPSDVEPDEGVDPGIYDIDEHGIPKWL